MLWGSSQTLRISVILFTQQLEHGRGAGTLRRVQVLFCVFYYYCTCQNKSGQPVFSDNATTWKSGLHFTATGTLYCCFTNWWWLKNYKSTTICRNRSVYVVTLTWFRADKCTKKHSVVCNTLNRVWHPLFLTSKPSPLLPLTDELLPKATGWISQYDCCSLIKGEVRITPTVPAITHNSRPVHKKNNQHWRCSFSCESSLDLIWIYHFRYQKASFLVGLFTPCPHLWPSVLLTSTHSTSSSNS